MMSSRAKTVDYYVRASESQSPPPNQRQPKLVRTDYYTFCTKGCNRGKGRTEVKYDAINETCKKCGRELAIEKLEEYDDESVENPSCETENDIKKLREELRRIAGDNQQQSTRHQHKR